MQIVSVLECKTNCNTHMQDADAILISSLPSNPGNTIKTRPMVLCFCFECKLTCIQVTAVIFSLHRRDASGLTAHDQTEPVVCIAPHSLRSA